MSDRSEKRSPLLPKKTRHSTIRLDSSNFVRLSLFTKLATDQIEQDVSRFRTILSRRVRRLWRLLHTFCLLKARLEGNNTRQLARCVRIIIKEFRKQERLFRIQGQMNGQRCINVAQKIKERNDREKIQRNGNNRSCDQEVKYVDCGSRGFVHRVAYTVG